jgi:dihydrolipoamide dehydrogenase
MYDLAVIGAGPGGYVAAIRAAQLGLKTVCIDKRPQLGGTCLNVGCIPSKTLLQATEFYWKVAHEGSAYGLEGAAPVCNWEKVLARKEQIVASFGDGIAALFQKNKIERVTGTASFVNPTTLSVDGKQELSARHILIATGSEPISLPFLPFDEERILSSAGALSLKRVPKTLIVIGAGIIGVELGSVYSRLGTHVTCVEFLDRVCPTLDTALSKGLHQLLAAQGMTFHLSARVTGADLASDRPRLTAALPSGEGVLEADAVLVSIGRRPYTQGLNLDKAGIALTAKGQVPVDAHFRTPIPHIFAIGDIIDGPMLAHKASEEGMAAAELIAGHAAAIDYMAIPNVVYTHPEVASVGLAEAEAKELGLTVRTGSFSFKANSRARCSGEEEGFVKVVAEAHTDRIVGVHILGAHASELIAAGALAIQQKVTALQLALTPHAHPTLSEALKEAALAVHKRRLHA